MKQKLTTFFFANSFQMQLIVTYYINIGLLKLSEARKYSICMDGSRTQTYMPPSVDLAYLPNADPKSATILPG
jgi:hypothetical protein